MRARLLTLTGPVPTNVQRMSDERLDAHSCSVKGFNQLVHACRSTTLDATSTTIIPTIDTKNSSLADFKTGSWHWAYQQQDLVQLSVHIAGTAGAGVFVLPNSRKSVQVSKHATRLQHFHLLFSSLCFYTSS